MPPRNTRSHPTTPTPDSLLRAPLPSARKRKYDIVFLAATPHQRFRLPAERIRRDLALEGLESEGTQPASVYKLQGRLEPAICYWANASDRSLIILV